MKPCTSVYVHVTLNFIFCISSNIFEMLRAVRHGLQRGDGLDRASVGPKDDLVTKIAVGVLTCFAGTALVTCHVNTPIQCSAEQGGDRGGDRGEERAPMKLSAIAKLPGRLGRDAFCAGGMVADYLWSLSGLEPGGDLYEKEMAACHERGAHRLLNLCFSNGGIYIKLGQHIAMLDHLLPEVYVRTMRNNLLDKCPVSSWKAVARTIREDLGLDWDDMFSEMDRIPVASASLAQVHKAIDKETGRTLAVKVQHEDLRETSSVDLMAIEGLVRLVKYVAPEADYTWLVREANENLPRELDFRIEADNAFICKQMLESSSALRGKVSVPDVDLSRTSARVLTMEWIDGVSISDTSALKEMGCNSRGLARIIAKCFSEMIYRHGNVHADPHVANMLVRRRAKGEGGGWQLVLLDHGLYRRLDDNFRLEYSKLWRALILGDVKGITESATKMNAADSVPLFAGMLTQRQWRDVTRWEKGSNRLKHDRTEREKEEIQEFVGQHAQEIGSLLGKLPRELLLLLKTNDCLRSVDKELGAGYNTFMVTARECVRTINAVDRTTNPGIRSKVRSILERAKLEMRLQVMQMYSLFF
jgi:aarF domain-containing kinase